MLLSVKFRLDSWLRCTATNGRLVQRSLWNKDSEPEKELPDDADHVDRITFETAADQKQIMQISRMYENNNEKSKQTFLDVIDAFSSRSQFKSRLGQCEFIYGSMKMLKQFGLHKDIEVYKRLLDVMPKGKMVPKNYFQEMSVYYAKHQATAIQLLDYMSQNHVAPDKELEAMVGRIFGDRSMVWRKVARMNYWMAKWYRSSPFPLPEKLPNESLDLAKFVLKRICPDIQTRIHTYQTAVLEDCLDQTWIVSAQSPVQRDIVTTLAEPLYVEGPFECVLNESRIGYFVLRTGPPKRFTVPTEDPDPFDVSNLKFDLFGGSNKTGAIAATQNLHKQSDGTIIALCCTGTSSRDSLLSWIRILEHLDPNLKKLKVIFKLKAPSPTDMVHVKQQSYSPMTSDLNSNQKGA